MNEQVDVLGLAVHFNQLRLEVQADLLENDFEPMDGVSVKYLSSVLCDEDQMDM